MGVDVFLKATTRDGIHNEKDRRAAVSIQERVAADSEAAVTRLETPLPAGPQLILVLSPSLPALDHLVNLLTDLALVTLPAFHVWFTPYTKVEESFNLHAVHDHLMYGVAPQSLINYDHFVFPGAVPRSFLGSLFLALGSYPPALVAQGFGGLKSKFQLQIMARMVLAGLNALGFCLVRRVVARRFDAATGIFFTLLTCLQFHLPFWMGRTLPNMFALLPVNLAFALILSRSGSPKSSGRRLDAALVLLISAAVVIRAEIALLFAPLALQLLMTRQVTLSHLFSLGVVTGTASMVATVLVDSYFWNQWPLWPELNSLYFNVYQGRSADWGVSPPLEYVTRHIPKLALGSLPLCCIGVVIDSRLRRLLLPAAIFVVLISCLSHKEWRFIIYIVPLINVGASRAAAWMFRRAPLLTWCLRVSVVAVLCGNLITTATLTVISHKNYAGGEAMWKLHQGLDPSASVHLHICNFAAQTGASLFMQEHSPPTRYLKANIINTSWIYNKTEGLSTAELSGGRFTHVIVEDWNEVRYPETEWEVLNEIRAFDRVTLRAQSSGSEWRRRIPLPRIHTKAKLWILRRKQS